MTDNKIIKGFEVCNDRNAPCTLCPYKGNFPECVEQLFTDGQNLITRQKAEISNLTSRLTSLQNDLTSAKAEIERLNNNISAMAITLSNSAKATRHDAIKEFAERVKGKSLAQYSFEIKDWYWFVKVKDIENLVKEMVGDE